VNLNLTAAEDTQAGLWSRQVAFLMQSKIHALIGQDRPTKNARPRPTRHWLARLFPAF